MDRGTKTKEDKLIFKANDNKGGRERRARTFIITMGRASKYSNSSYSLPKAL